MPKPIRTRRQPGLTLLGLVPITIDELDLLRGVPYERSRTMNTPRDRKIARHLLERGLLKCNEDMFENGILHVRQSEHGTRTALLVTDKGSRDIFFEVEKLVDVGDFVNAEIILNLLMERIIIEYALEAGYPIPGTIHVLHNLLEWKDRIRREVEATARKLDAARPAIVEAAKRELDKIAPSRTR